MNTFWRHQNDLLLRCEVRSNPIINDIRLVNLGRHVNKGFLINFARLLDEKEEGNIKVSYERKTRSFQNKQSGKIGLGMRRSKLEKLFLCALLGAIQFSCYTAKEDTTGHFLLIKTSSLILRSLDILLQNVMSTEIDYMVFC